MHRREHRAQRRIGGVAARPIHPRKRLLLHAGARVRRAADHSCAPPAPRCRPMRNQLGGGPDARMHDPAVFRLDAPWLVGEIRAQRKPRPIGQRQSTARLAPSAAKLAPAPPCNEARAGGALLRAGRHTAVPPAPPARDFNPLQFPRETLPRRWGRVSSSAGVAGDFSNAANSWRRPSHGVGELGPEIAEK